ncbi:hypothetical protein J6590_002435 [Homalodisca vitripennis]|nr:hypothetical protein J6590_002435 [Homalodisca vitripennis]
MDRCGLSKHVSPILHLSGHSRSKHRSSEETSGPREKVNQATDMVVITHQASYGTVERIIGTHMSNLKNKLQFFLKAL